MIVELTHIHKELVERTVAQSWGSRMIVAHRELFDTRALPAFIALSDEDELQGYCFYNISGAQCEIVVLEAVRQNIGVGTALINRVVETARSNGCTRVFLETSNDNTHALRFYQRHGFTLCAVRLNEYDYMRTLKPSIPLIGEDGIPLLHEMEFEMVL